ncbi:glycosyltransferase [Psychroserpens luteus]|uniref:Glycosyltransferase n=1 Tax=Psychroserpens luteus TaxID=1434066 RepID=A0ABW5ZTA5_9FLAO|nr:glycosyltransferase [Psychroserpens luteus]
MPKRIKILFTIPNFDTAGSGKVVYDLVRGLDKNKFNPEICCFHDKGAFFKNIEQLGVPVHLFKFTADYKPLVSLPFRILKISKFFAKHKFDMIHSWHWSSDFTEPLAAKIAGIPFVYTKKAMGWGNKSWRWRTRLSSKIIAINKDMLEQFFINYKSKTVYMPLGVDTTKFDYLETKRSTPNGHVFKDSDFVIVSIANLVPVKGIEVLLNAVKQLDNDSIQVLIVGDKDNDYGESLEKEFASKQIHFIGKQLDVKSYLAVANVFVIPTKDEGRKEGMPIAPLEAMASGRIVIGSNISGIKDILINFNSLLFEPNNSAALTKVLINIISLNPEERLSLGRELRSNVENSYSLDSCIKHHESLYINVLKA